LTSPINECWFAYLIAISGIYCSI